MFFFCLFSNIWCKSILRDYHRKLLLRNNQQILSSEQEKTIFMVVILKDTFFQEKWQITDLSLVQVLHNSTLFVYCDIIHYIFWTTISIYIIKTFNVRICTCMEIYFSNYETTFKIVKKSTVIISSKFARSLKVWQKF